MSEKGLAFHVYHDKLIDYCYDYDERVAYIKKYKPKSEREMRLRLFKIIPPEMVPREGLGAYDKVRDAHDRAREAYIKARDAFDKAYSVKARETYYEAMGTYHRAGDAFGMASRAYGKVNEDKLDALHNKLCPDCPWDGHTIFPKEVKDE